MKAGAVRRDKLREVNRLLVHGGGIQDVEGFQRDVSAGADAQPEQADAGPVGDADASQAQAPADDDEEYARQNGQRRKYDAETLEIDQQQGWRLLIAFGRRPIDDELDGLVVGDGG